MGCGIGGYLMLDHAPSMVMIPAASSTRPMIQLAKATAKVNHPMNTKPAMTRTSPTRTIRRFVWIGLFQPLAKFHHYASLTCVLITFRMTYPEVAAQTNSDTLTFHAVRQSFRSPLRLEVLLTCLISILGKRTILVTY